MSIKSIVIAAGTAALALIAACGGSGSTLSGHLAITYDDSGNTSGLCPGPMPADITAGTTQVIVKAPDGTVIGTGNLGKPSQKSAGIPGCFAYIMTMPFKVIGLPGESRYGVEVGSHGTVWFQPSQISHVDLSLGG